MSIKHFELITFFQKFTLNFPEFYTYQLKKKKKKPYRNVIGNLHLTTRPNYTKEEL